VSPLIRFFKLQSNSKQLFCQDQDFYLKTKTLESQDQDQDFIFCPWGTSRPRPWSQGRHQCC